MTPATIIYQLLSRSPLGVTADAAAAIAGVEANQARVILNAACKERLCRAFARSAFDHEGGRSVRVFVPMFKQGDLFNDLH